MFADIRTKVKEVKEKKPEKVKQIQKTGPEVVLMTNQLTAIFKKSLKSNRWNKLDLGAPAEYTHENMINHWVIQKNKWLQRTPQIGGSDGEQDVKGTTPCGLLSQDATDSARLAAIEVLKKQIEPYGSFDKYYPLEDTIKLCDEVWK